jgi:hypothetical protein
VHVHLRAEFQRDLDGVHHQPVAFELHLPARDVEAGDELLVGAGRGMGEDRLVELRLDLWKSTSLTSSIEPCRIADIDLWVELVW